MKKVYVLFEVYGDPDGNVCYDFLSVHTNKEDAFDTAKDLYTYYESDQYFTPNDDIQVCLTDEYMRVSMNRKEYLERVIQETDVLLMYGDFGGFVIEEATLMSGKVV